MRLKYRFKRWRVFLERGRPKQLELDDVQKKAYNIAVRLINDKDSELMVDPKTGRNGIVKKDMSVKIGINRISIFNGTHYYDIAIDEKTRNAIIEKFNNKLSRKFNAFDNQLTYTVNKTLDNIRLNIDESEI